MPVSWSQHANSAISPINLPNPACEEEREISLLLGISLHPQTSLKGTRATPKPAGWGTIASHPWEAEELRQLPKIRAEPRCFLRPHGLELAWVSLGKFAKRRSRV